MSGRSKSDNQIVLSYHDSLLRNSDVDLLRGPHWINDTIIGFYLEYMDKITEESTEPKTFLFVGPEFTQLLKLATSSDCENLLESISAKSSSFLFFPLNNCDSRESAGGTHWSLLLFSKPEKSFFHFDSAKGTNSLVAKNFVKSITCYFGDQKSVHYFEVNIPQQENGYDCGLYVLCCIDLLANHIATESKVEGCSFDSLKMLVGRKRNKLLELIDYFKNLKAEADR